MLGGLQLGARGPGWVEADTSLTTSEIITNVQTLSIAAVDGNEDFGVSQTSSPFIEDAIVTPTQPSGGQDYWNRGDPIAPDGPKDTSGQDFWFRGRPVNPLNTGAVGNIFETFSVSQESLPSMDDLLAPITYGYLDGTQTLSQTLQESVPRSSARVVDPRYIDSKTGTTNATFTVSPTLPAWEDGDVVFIEVAMHAASTAYRMAPPATPTGWTKAHNFQEHLNTDPTPPSYDYSLYWRIMKTGDAAPTFVFTDLAYPSDPSSYRGAWGAVTYRSVHQITPLEVTASSDLVGNNNQQSMASVTAGHDDGMILTFVPIRGASGAVSVTDELWSDSRYSVLNTTGSGNIGLYHTSMNAPCARSYTPQVTLASGTPLVYHGVVIALSGQYQGAYVRSSAYTGEVDQTGPGTFTFNLPSDKRVGDVLFATVLQGNAGAPNGGFTTPSGWSLVATTTDGNNTIATYTRVVDGSEGSTQNIAGLATGGQYPVRYFARVTSWWGVDTTTPVERIHGRIGWPYGTSYTGVTLESQTADQEGDVLYAIAMSSQVFTNMDFTPASPSVKHFRDVLQTNATTWVGAYRRATAAGTLTITGDFTSVSGSVYYMEHAFVVKAAAVALQPPRAYHAVWGQTTAIPTDSIPLPAYDVGDTVVIFINWWNQNGNLNTVTPSGWKVLGGGWRYMTAAQCTAIARVMDGTEGSSVSVTVSGSFASIQYPAYWAVTYKNTAGPDYSVQYADATSGQDATMQFIAPAPESYPTTIVYLGCFFTPYGTSLTGWDPDLTVRSYGRANGYSQQPFVGEMRTMAAGTDLTAYSSVHSVAAIYAYLGMSVALLPADATQRDPIVVPYLVDSQAAEGAAVTESGTTFYRSVSLPNYTAGDVVVIDIQVSASSENIVMPTPTGWTVMHSDPYGSYASGTLARKLLRRTMDGTEGSSVTFNFTGHVAGGSVSHSYEAWCFRGVDALDVEAYSQASPSGSATASGTTSYRAERTLLWVSGEPYGTPVGRKASPPGAFQELRDYTANSGGTGVFWYYIAQDHTPVSGTAYSITLDILNQYNPSFTADNVYWRALLLSLKPVLPVGGSSVVDTLSTSQESTQTNTSDAIGIHDALVTSQEAQQSLVEFDRVERFISSQESTQTMDEAGYSGETNILDLSQVLEVTIVDYIISYQDDFDCSQEGVPSIVEIVNSADVLTVVQTNYQDDMTRYENFALSETNAQSLYEVYDADIAETLDATSGADSTGVGGYNISGVNIPSIVESYDMEYTDTTAPTLDAVYMSGDTVTLVYSETLDPASVPDASAFSVTVRGSACAVTDVAIDLNQVILTTSCYASPGNLVVVSYSVPALDPIQDLVGNDARGFTWEDVNTVDPPPDPVDRGGGGGQSYGPRGISLAHVHYRAGDELVAP